MQIVEVESKTAQLLLAISRTNLHKSVEVLTVNFHLSSPLMITKKFIGLRPVNGRG